MKILNTTVFSTALNGCETWTFTVEIRRILLAFERKCYQKIMRVKWTQKITTDTIFSRVYRKETILQKAIRRNMSLFVHVWKISDDLAPAPHCRAPTHCLCYFHSYPRLCDQ